MKITAIVSEYNPFHNGHKYLADKARENGATHTVAIMGGNFLQRGECAVMDKYARAKVAVLGGIDLVLELPVIYAVSSAEGFASGAVETLDNCGVIDELCFGAECGDIEQIRKAVEMTCSEKLLDICKEYKNQGYSHPRAMQAAAQRISANKNSDSGEDIKNAVELLSSPNNTLGVEYIRAVDRLKSNISPFAVERKGVEHNSSVKIDGFASASAIREMIFKNENEFSNYIPITTREIIKESISKGECPSGLIYGERAVMSILRRMTVDDLTQIPDVTEGLENRIYKAIRECNSIEEIISQIKCKRYTYARLSRILTCAYLGVTKELSAEKPQYIRVLAFNDRGAEVLRQMKKSATLPIVMSPARDKNKLSDIGKALLEKDILASDLYGLMTPKIKSCSSDYFTGAIKI